MLYFYLSSLVFKKSVIVGSVWASVELSIKQECHCIEFFLHLVYALLINLLYTWDMYAVVHPNSVVGVHM